MGQSIFYKAVERFAEANSSEDDGSFEKLERLERLILGHFPNSPAEAVMIMDLIIPNLLAGGRSDGRDVSALINIREMLRTSAI